MLLCIISFSVRSCVVHVKYCLAVDMAGVAYICRGLWCVCGWKNVKRYRDGSLSRTARARGYVSGVDVTTHG